MAKEYWIQRDGTKIDIDSMSLSHLRNTLKMLVRNANYKKPKESLKSKIELKGDMALEFNNSFPEDEYDNLLDDDVYGYY
jgi:hypothetical protein